MSVRVSMSVSMSVSDSERDKEVVCGGGGMHEKQRMKREKNE
jgi:hypothetical protein